MKSKTGFPSTTLSSLLAICTCLGCLGEGGDNGSEQQDGGEQRDAFDPSDFAIESYQAYPRVDGSTSAEPLQVLIACKLLGVNCLWKDYFDGSQRLKADDSDSVTEDIAGFINQNIIHNGTHGSYVNLIEGNTDLILVARAPSQDELELAEDNRVEIDIEPVALDAFVFIFNVNNPVDGLTTREIQRIYTGDITQWSEVGGTESDINPYQRDVNSGSQQLMLSLVMKDLEMIDAPDMILEGMMGPINMISEDENGLGYSVYFYERFMAPNQHLKLIRVDAVMPNDDNIRSRSYPYATEVYVAIRNDLESDSIAYQLREWLLTDDGQKIVEESGYVPTR